MTHTNDWRRPTKRLNSVLLPTLGRPRMTQLNSSAFTGALFEDDDSGEKKGRGWRRKRSELTVVVMRRCKSEKLRMREMQQRCRGAATRAPKITDRSTSDCLLLLSRLFSCFVAAAPPHTAATACELPQSHVTCHGRVEAVNPLKKIKFYICFPSFRLRKTAKLPTHVTHPLHGGST